MKRVTVEELPIIADTITQSSAADGGITAVKEVKEHKADYNESPIVFTICGFYKDDGAEFNNYLVTGYDCVPDGYEEEEIFFFGLSEQEIKEAIESGIDTCHDFVITSYETVE